MSILRTVFPWAARYTRSSYNPDLERRALREWRSRHSLMDRVVEQHTMGRTLTAMRLARYYYGQDAEVDVAHWPKIKDPRPRGKVRVLERRRALVVCPTCRGNPYMPANPPWTWEERWCPECGGDGVVKGVVDTPMTSLIRVGYEPETWQTNSGEWIASVRLESGQMVAVGGKDEDQALRYLAGELGVYVEEEVRDE